MRFLYRPGSSPLHRCPAGAKLLLLVAAGVGLVLLRDPLPASAALLAAVLLYPVASFGPRVLWQQARPVLPVLVVVGVLHGLSASWPGAYVTVVGLLALVLLAALVTLTTRTTALVDVVVRVLRPLRIVGVDPERVGLLLALGVRSVPVVLDLAAEVREAQHARGLAASPRAFAVPLVVRSMRHADALGEALAARGVDD
ncbi:energy-coupling factor transporter transmembrane protein EcfT [Nocardioides mangrovicus]|uniref:Energy-coupling factor transporter transmembrane protein EcfT n=1 Tax=Nocardioides mangrovicus TaxID=2478913 RepID=A0A3L8P256_9ACTN|nr:energy-coupling factor transporter transmembrane component T [Nocardioides mangrovicus]RLV49375.1 energy-coupling factor transporter transmembrane protein EcfT [Nocardioides mangrovicus]